MNAHSIAKKSKYIANSYRAYFQIKDGDYENKELSLKNFVNWDCPMRPDIKISNCYNEDSIWFVTFNETNDFAKLIGYPGWKAKMQIIFNPKDLIEETIYISDSTNLPYKPFLLPAIEWLKEKMPDELNKVYQDNKLVKTKEAAKRWKKLLKLWKKSS